MAKLIPVLLLVACLGSASQLSAQEMTKPLGRWERKIGKNHVTLIIDESRLHMTIDDDKAATLHADYAMTRDGLIYGVITSVECDNNEEVDATMNLFETMFSFRFRIDEGALIIHEMKAPKQPDIDDAWNGRYKVVRPSASRAAVVPTNYDAAIPQYLVPPPVPYYSPSPSPIASSFSSSKGAEKPQPINSKETGNIFNFWAGFSR